MPEEGLAAVIGPEAEVDLETEGLQEVIKGIGQGLMVGGVQVVQVRMVGGVLTGQGRMSMEVHPDIGQGLMTEEVLQGMEDPDRLEGATRNYKLLLN